MRINHNISSMITQGSLIRANRDVSKSIERLSTGLRINSAADDAAGLGVSENLRTQVRGMGQALKNTQDSIALLQTADGALNEQAEILQRMRELVIQAKNDTYTQTERNYMGDEFRQLGQELDRIALVTNYNGMRLFAWHGPGYVQNVNNDPPDIADGRTLWDDQNNYVFGINDNGTSHHFNMQIGGNFTTADQNALNAGTNSYDPEASNYLTIQLGQMDFRGLFSKQRALATPMGILTNGGTRNVFAYNPMDANNFTDIGDKLNYLLELIDGNAAGKAAPAALVFQGTNTTGLQRVNEMRAQIGALVNRLEHNVNNLTTGISNQQSAESAVRDLDFAKETSSFTKNQILTQSATAMLSQANMQTQSVLQLIR